jgi:hypothetical protein
MEQRSFSAILLLLVAVPGFRLESEPALFSRSDGWKLSGENRGITLYSRPRPGSSLREFKAVGEIEASVHTVHDVIDDTEEYVSFMPFITECRLIKREADSIISYQRLSPKICRDRDYTLRVRETSWAGPGGGLVYFNQWESANESGPAEKKGIVRVKVCEGGWLLEPEDATRTRATYTVYTDTGGAIPAFIANRASQIAIGRLFVAVRKQVKDPKYSLSER